MLEYYRFFANKGYAEEFLRGNIFMNYLGWFWEHGFEGQNDFADGSLFTMDPSQTPFPEDLKKVIEGNVVTRELGYRYCNICSFTRLIVNHKEKYVAKFNPRIKSFGDYVVRIKNFDAFQYRFSKAAYLNNDIALGGPVNYTEPSNQRELNCFCKLEEFNWQFEWRIAYLHDLEDIKKDAQRKRPLESQFAWEPFTLGIGDISDICELYPAEDMWNDKLQTIYPGYTVFENIAQKGMLTEEETVDLLKEVNYGFGVGVKNECQFQAIVQSLFGQARVMFRI